MATSEKTVPFDANLRRLEGKKGLVIGIANEQLDRLRLRESVPLVRRRARAHLPERQGQALRRAARAGARGADLHAARRPGRRARWRRVFTEIGRRFGRLDFALHSIAFAPKADLQGRVVDCSREGFLLAMDVSCHSFIRMARLAEPLMKHGGALFTMSYFGAERVVENYNLMGPVKAALEASARYLAAELGPKGIRVHAISPGPLKTRAASGIAHFDALLDQAAERAPARRLVTIEDVGFAVAGLATDAARLITGDTIYIDGGYHIMG